ncbi:energy transducer TonB [Roseomonas sp. M0104]|uniref:Energy transducer TonB n=1 Tax=Teichococcus coralli TaxID=2545983 RepID=A0A845BG49_9PROT|nr:energy transducer TonB [Pseudoroseomonas coralli]MXP62459.1 energy transducer TonB [Pseudoroseomonas coralli]
MSLTASAPPLFPGGPRRPRRSWRRPAAWISLALHLALLVALVLWGRPRQLPSPGMSEGVEVVFESQTPPQEAPSAPAAEAPAPQEPPDAQAPPATPPPPPAAASPPAPAPATEAPPPPVEAPPQPAPAPAPVPAPAPAPAPPLPQAPEASLPPAPEPMPELDTPPELTAPTPLELNPPPPPPPQPTAPPRPASPFAGTVDLGRSIPMLQAPQPAPRRRPPPGGQVDMAIGSVPERSLMPRRDSPTIGSPLSYVSGAKPSLDWGSAFQQWVQRRMFYPRAAVQAGEDGAVVLRVTVEKDGRISAVRVTTSSGSRWLDSASLSLFRDQMGPAFPPEMVEQQNSTTLTFTTNYILR